MSAIGFFWLGLALKMLLTATVVVVTSLLVERSGPFVGALIGSLPTAAGAAYIILAIQHPPDFIAASAIGTITVNGAIAVFAVVYATLAQRHGLFVSLGAATLAWFAIATALRAFDWTLFGALAVNVAIYAVTIPLSWRYRAAQPGPVKFLRTRYDIPLRALTAAVVVSVVTTASSHIGSFASGAFAVFPIILGSSIVIMHPRIGGKLTASMMAHTQFPLMGLAFGFVAVYYLVAPAGVWLALLGGLIVSLAWSGMLLVLNTRMRGPRAA